MRFGGSAKFAFGKAGGMQTLRFDHPRADGVDADLARSQFLGQRPVIATTAALEPLYTEALGGADVAATELMLTMLPPA